MEPEKPEYLKPIVMGKDEAASILIEFIGSLSGQKLSMLAGWVLSEAVRNLRSEAPTEG